MSTTEPRATPAPDLTVYPMPRRWHVRLPGAGGAVVEAVTQEAAIAAFEKRTGISSPTHRHSVRLNGKDHYLGRWPDDRSEAPPDVQAKYDQTIAEWLARNRQMPCPTPGSGESSGPIINEIILAYWPTVEKYYRHPDGTPTQEVDNIRLALRRLRRLYGRTEAVVFDSLTLEALREHMIQDGLSRSRINRDVPRIKRMFQWAATKKLVPATVWQELMAVKGLRAGRSSARETAPVRPVADAVIEITLPHLLPPVEAMVRLQRCTGARPGEVIILRPRDVDTTGTVWAYRPGSDQGETGKHKNSWRGHERIILIGPRGQDILRPFLQDREPHVYCFSPAEARAHFDARRRAKRKSKVPPSQQRRRPKSNPQRKPRDRYTPSTYSQAVADGCIKAHVQACENCRRRGGESRNDWLCRVANCEGLKAISWHPNQLRHAAATEIRKVAGLDPARAVLGHRSPVVTTVYAEADMHKAAEVMKLLG